MFGVGEEVIDFGLVVFELGRLERLDQVWHKQRHYSKVNVEKMPSECFHDHIWTCFIRDEAGIEARHRIGVDKIMFEADYPHSDTQWPNSRKSLSEQLLDVPDDEARKIAGLTAASLLRI